MQHSERESECAYDAILLEAGLSVFVDARSLSENTVAEYDVCIIGAGAAGITLAREFSGQEFRVCLLESGGFEFDAATQSLYQGENIGPLKMRLDAERMRHFGGTTNLWGGYCRPLDEQDFEERDWVPNSGWPFRRSELEPFYERAHELCHLGAFKGAFKYDVNAWNSKSESAIPFNNGRLVTKFFKLVPTQPLDFRLFGNIYRDYIYSSANIMTYLYANVTNFRLSEDGNTVIGVAVKTISGNKISITSKIFVLATGAIENARLLLISKNYQKTGIGNAYDLVGRYFMTHLELQAGMFVPAPGTSMQYFNAEEETVPILALSEELCQQYKLVNFTAEVGASPFPAPSPGVESFHELAQSIRSQRVPDDLVWHIGRILADSGNVAAAIYDRMRGEEPTEAYVLTNASETVPNPESRVTLSSAKDQLDCSRVVLNWTLSPLDTDSLRRGYEIIGQELGRAGLGRLKISLDTQFGSAISGDGGAYWSQHHHMGTTRMHIDPKKGVVNANCQVHGVSNLFIAGGSVFPTSGSATPTFTIIALAVRLADYIKARMR